MPYAVDHNPTFVRTELVEVLPFFWSGGQERQCFDKLSTNGYRVRAFATLLQRMTNALDPWLLAKLVCPMTRTPLRYDAAAQELVSAAAGLAYPIDRGVPVLIVEAARRLDLESHDF